MNSTKLTIRLNASQFQMLDALSKQHGIPRYRMLAKIIDNGFAAITRVANPQFDWRDLVKEIAAQSVRITSQERMLDRALFTTCAAYCYARVAASGVRKNDADITTEITAAYDRQRRIAEDHHHGK